MKNHELFNVEQNHKRNNSFIFLKSIIFPFCFVVFFTCTFGNNSMAQCPNDNTPYLTNDASSWALAANNTLTTCLWGGEYTTVIGLIPGATYTFQTCGDLDFDTEITIYTAGGAFVAHNDDGCGLQSSAIFVSDGSDVHVLIDEYGCLSNTVCMTLIGTLVAVPCVPNGDQSTYGSDSWIGYVYNSSSAGAFSTYDGYITEPETFNRIHTSPTGATSDLCGNTGTDLFTIKYKMTKNFPSGYYNFTIGGDDGVRLSLDGGSTWHINGWVNQGYTTYSSSSAQYLSGNTNLVFEYYENTGGSQSSFSYSCVTPDQPSTIIGTSDPVPGASETYSVTNVSNMTYTWTVPSGWTITSGQGTNSITATVGNTNGSITCMPSTACATGTARSFSTTIPNYRAELSNITYGSSTWCGGEERDVTIDVKNTGIQTFSTTYNTNLGVKWNHWSDYHVRVPVDLTPGASQTYTLTIEGKDATQGPAYTTDLDGSYTLQFDLVNEMSCWFANNSGSCGPGNSIAQSSSITHAPAPTSPSATADGASSVDICSGGSSQLSGSADDETVATTESGSQTFNWSGSSKYDGGTASVLGDYVEGTISGLPADATITSITYSTDINYCSNGSANCATWWGAELYVNGTYQALACDVTNASYSGLNSSIANGNVLRLWIYDIDNWNDCTNITFDVTVNYEYSGTTNVAATYSWSPSTGLSATNIANPVASPTSSQTYTMTAAYSTGCSSTATASVTVNELPSNSSVAISTTSSPPKDSEDISASVSTSDPESATVYAENDWRVGGTSFAVQNFSFDANGSDGLTSNSSQGGALTAYGDAAHATGVKGKAYEFDGVSDYLQNTGVNIDPSVGLSISFWQYSSTTASNTGGDAYHQWISLGPGQQMVVRNSFTNAVEAYVSTGGDLTGWCNACGTGDFIYRTGQVSSGSGNHWVVTWNPDRTFKLYKNGTLLQTNTAGVGSLSTITSLTISGSSTENFNGKMDEVLIFERAISADQVTALYNSGTPSYASIASDETTCGETWTLSSSPVDAFGCKGSATLSSGVTISGAQVSTADVIDEATCGIDEYAISIDDLNDSGIWSVSPVDAALINFPSAPSTSITASPVAGGFNQDLTLTWTPADGNCAADNVVIKFNQPNESITQDTDTWIWGGQTNTTWTTGANWYKWDGSKWAVQSSSTPDANSKVHILSNATAGICVSGSNTGVVSAGMSSLNVGDGASLDLGSQNINITDDIVNNGTIIAGTGTVNLVGTETQTISGLSSAVTDFSELVINNPNHITMQIPVTVKSQLTLTTGNILNGANVLTLGTSSLNPGTTWGVGGHIVGKFRRYFANTPTSVNFYVGDGTVSRSPVIIFTDPPGTNQYLTVEYVQGVPMDGSATLWEGLPLITGDGEVIQNYSEQGYWQIDPTNDDYNSEINNKAYTIRLPMIGLSGVTDYTKVRVITSHGSNTPGLHHDSWTALTHISSAGSNSDFVVNSLGIGFSFFGGGGGGGNQLPVELISINGSCTDGVVELSWQTASEYNSSHYELEHSRDGATWSVVNTQAAAGNSTELLTYNYTDLNALAGDNYYRLTQVDLDGAEEVYEVINASCAELTSDYFSVYPNPSYGTFNVILNNSDIVGDGVMRIVDTKGMLVLEKTIEVKNGINMYPVNQKWSPGMYFISISNGQKSTPILRHSVQ